MIEAGPLHGLGDPREGERDAVREHEALRERALVLGVEVHQLGDPVVEEAPPWTEQAVQRGHVEVDSLLSHVLDHADARDRVELLAGDLAVVGEPELHQVLHPGLADPLAPELDLALGQSHSEHADPVVLGGVNREAPPAATDVEYALARLERELLADQVELCPLGLLERLRTTLEVGAAVGHRRVEEQREELVAGVVVVADSASVAPDRVALAAQAQL